MHYKRVFFFILILIDTNRKESFTFKLDSLIIVPVKCNFGKQFSPKSSSSRMFIIKKVSEHGSDNEQRININKTTTLEGTAA